MTNVTFPVLVYIAKIRIKSESPKYYSVISRQCDSPNAGGRLPGLCAAGVAEVLWRGVRLDIAPL